MCVVDTLNVNYSRKKLHPFKPRVRHGKLPIMKWWSIKVIYTVVRGSSIASSQKGEKHEHEFSLRK